MVNVLHVSDKLTVGKSKIHGVTRLFSWWVPLLNKQGYNTSICSLRCPDSGGDYLEQKGIKVFYLNKSKFDPSTLSALLSLLKREKIDILHLHGYGAWTFGRVARLISGVSVILHEHFFDPNMPIYQQFVDFLFRGMSCPVIATSKAVKDFCIQSRKIMPHNIEVLFNGIPLDEFIPAKASPAIGLKKEFGISEDRKLIGTISRLDTQKGIEYFIRAIPRILSQFPKTSFFVVGDGPLMETLRRLSMDFSLERDVHFIGFRKNIVDVLKELDIVVIPSLWEGTTLTVFETMSMGKPIVSSDVDGLKEVLEDNETALLFPPKDSLAIADKILLLLKNPRQAEYLARTAKEAVKKFDVVETVCQLKKHYDALLGVRGK